MFFLKQTIWCIYFPISGCEAQLVSINRHFSVGWRDKKPGIMFCISLKSLILMWFSMGHNVRKWVSSSTSELHNWQILWLRGVFGLLCWPVSSSKGRHPHLIWAIVLLLLYLSYVCTDTLVLSCRKMKFFTWKGAPQGGEGWYVVEVQDTRNIFQPKVVPGPRSRKLYNWLLLDFIDLYNFSISFLCLPTLYHWLIAIWT